MKHKLHIHKFKTENRCWQSIDTEDKEAPRFNLSQHSVSQYKRCLYLVGGVSIFPSTE